MNNAEAKWGPERGYHFYKTSETAVKMIVERLNMEKIGLPLTSLPLCPEEFSDAIEELIPRAKEGFALSFKSEISTVSQDSDLLNITTPITVEKIWKQLTLTNRQNTLPEYGHVIATLVLLSQSGKVSFYDFADPPINLDFQTSMAQTYWFHITDSFERVWNAMDEIESLTRQALYSSKPMKRLDMLKIGHFFMTGKTLSRIFDKR